MVPLPRADAQGRRSAPAFSSPCNASETGEGDHPKGHGGGAPQAAWQLPAGATPTAGVDGVAIITRPTSPRQAWGRLPRRARGRLGKERREAARPEEPAPLAERGDAPADGN